MAKLNPARLTVRLSEELKSDLEAIAYAQRPAVEPAELLRRAGVAIVDCWKQYKVLPADMEIRQRRLPHLESAAEMTSFLNEDLPGPAPAAIASTVTQQLRTAARESAAKPRVVRK